MKQTPFDTDIEVAEKIANDTKNSLAQLKRERAEYLCPFRVGQQLVNNRGKKAVITLIGSEDFGNGYRLTGQVLKSNGKLGVREGRLCEWDGWKEEALK